MRLMIQHMVSLRCKLVVESELKQLGLIPLHIELGEVYLMSVPSAAQMIELRMRLHAVGLEIIDNKSEALIEKIKIAVIEWVHASDGISPERISTFISQRLGREYHYISDLFSKSMGITIEHFVIEHKIERAKELLMEGDLSITEMAWKLNYSSVAHLSNQFKKHTGVTPSFYRKMQCHSRRLLESV